MLKRLNNINKEADSFLIDLYRQECRRDFPLREFFIALWVFIILYDYEQWNSQPYLIMQKE